MKPIRKHVVVCTGEDCIGRGEGGKVIWNALREKLAVRSLLHGRDLPGNIRVIQATCIGGCGFGPMIVIYPEGVFYAGVRTGDLDEIIHEHLLENRLVDRLYFFHTQPIESPWMSPEVADLLASKSPPEIAETVDLAVKDSVIPPPDESDAQHDR